MKRILLAAAAVVTLAAVPATAVAAASYGPGPGPGAEVTCTGDQQRLMLRDGTGPGHVAEGAGVQTERPTGHASGPQDGTGNQFHGPAWKR